MAQDIKIITDLLKEIKQSNTSHTKSIDRLLSDLNNKVEEIERNSASADLIKSYLTELTKSVENKYSTTLDRFSEIENALKTIFNSNDNHAKVADMKDLFDAFTQNLSNFYTDSRQQRAILSSIETKISEINSDKSDKEEIVRTISLLRKDFETLNQTYKDTVNSIGGDLKSIVSNLLKIDKTFESLQIKEQIDAVYNAMNDIIGFLKSVDKHETNLEKLLSNTATAESLKLAYAAITSISEKTDTISYEISNLASKEDVEHLSNSVEKNVTKEDFTPVVKKAEDLNDKAEELKKSLAKIAKNIGKLPDTSTIETTIQNLNNKLKDIQSDIIGTNVTSNVIELADKLNSFGSEIEVIKNIIHDLTENIMTKIMTSLEDVSFEKESYEIKNHISKMLSQLPQKEDVDRLLENDDKNYEAMGKLMNKTDDLADKLDNLPTQADMTQLKSNQAALAENLQSVVTKEDLNAVSAKTDEIEKMIDDLNFDDEFSNLYNKATTIEYWLNDSKIKENTNEILTKLDEKSDKKDVLNILKLTEDVADAIEELSQNADAKKVNRTVSEVYKIIEDLKNDFMNTSEMHNDSILVSISELQKSLDGFMSGAEFDNFVEDLKAFVAQVASDSQETSENYKQIKEYQKLITDKLNNTDTSAIEKLVTSNEDLGEKIINLKDFLKDVYSKENNEEIKHSLVEIKKILESKETENDHFRTKLSNIFDTYFAEIKSAIGSSDNEFVKNITGQIAHLESQVGDYTSSGKETMLKILEKLDNASKNIDGKPNSGALSSSVSEITELNNRISQLSKSFENIADSENPQKAETATFVAEKFDDISENIKSLTYEIENRLHAGFTYYATLLSDKTSVLATLIKNLRHENTKDIEMYERLTVADNKLSDAKQELELINTDVNAAFSQNSESVMEELSQIKGMLSDISSDKLKKDILESLEELHSEIINSDKTEISDTIQLEDSYKRISSELANNLRDFILSDIDSLIIKIDDMKADLQYSLDKMVPPDSGNMEEFREFADSVANFSAVQKALIDKAVSDIETKIDESQQQIVSLIKTNDNKDEIIEAIEDLKSYISNSNSLPQHPAKDDSDEFSSNIYEKEFENNKTADINIMPEIKAEFDKFSKRIGHLTGENAEIINILVTIQERISRLTRVNRPDVPDDKIAVAPEVNDFDLVKALDLFKEDILKIQKDNQESDKEAFAQIKSYISDDIGTILNEINSKIENLSKTDENEDISEIKKILEDIKNSDSTVSQDPEIIKMLKAIDSKIDILASTDNSLLIDEIRSAIDDLELSNNDDILKLINDKIDVIAAFDNSDDFEDIKYSLSSVEDKIEAVDKLSQSDEQITLMLEELNQKLDDVNSNTANEKFEDIKNLINSQTQYLETFEKNNKTEALQKCLDELSVKINSLSESDTTSEIQKSVREMKESIMSAVITVFDQISFMEESEDIKDFVEEKTDEINQNLVEVTNQLRQITNANDDDSYSYSMQDIETDLAKMRLALNEIQTSGNSKQDEQYNSIVSNISQIGKALDSLQTSLTKDENSENQDAELKEQFEKINNDLLNLSTLTNKFIVTSDESYGVIAEKLSSKVDNVTRLMEKSNESDKVMRQALIYMGEWIDSASENVSENSNNIVSIKETIEALKKDIPQQTEILTSIEEKYSEQQERLAFLEKQITKMSAIEERFASEQERLDRLEMKLEKVLSVIEEMDDSKFNRKIDKIDKQISKLSTNIEKLASYVE